ncbi:MAG: hypothetical protein WCG83_06820 [Candidatus Peregrinibacteria bacterium]
MRHIHHFSLLAISVLASFMATSTSFAWSIHMPPGPQAPLSDCLCPKTSVWDAVTKTCSRNKLVCGFSRYPQPFCGCDGKTYASICAAALAGVRTGKTCQGSSSSRSSIPTPSTVLTATMKNSNVLTPHTVTIRSGDTIVFTATPLQLRGFIAMDWDIRNTGATPLPSDMCEQDGWTLICTPNVKALSSFDITVASRLLGKTYPAPTTMHIYIGPPPPGK